VDSTTTYLSFSQRDLEYRNMKHIFLAVLMGLGLTSFSYAQDGDPQAGKAKAITCNACHGADGNSSNPDFPNLAGQMPGYIAKQLAKFKRGERNNPVMQAMVIALSPQDMQNLDAYYASLKPKLGSINEDQLKEATAGGGIYRGGYKPFNISACMSCHGPSGHGIPPNFPRVSGQHAAYIEKQLLAFKSGARKNSTMNPIAFTLSHEQIKQLSLYMSALY
jgi:cytochrome c553